MDEALKQFDEVLTRVDRELRIQGRTIPQHEAKAVVARAFFDLCDAMIVYEKQHGTPMLDCASTSRTKPAAGCFEAASTTGRDSSPTGIPATT